jgi:RNA polymerase sigma-70 factor (ECF subfamily)
MLREDGKVSSSDRRLGDESTTTMMELSAASDATLVVAIGRWNDSALAEVYRRHGGTVHALAQRILGPGGRADDVTQDVFVELWRRPERYDPSRGSLRAFLVTVAHGRAVDVLRSESARTGREQRTARETAAAGYDVENEVWDLAMADQLKLAISRLSEPERKAIELAYFSGHTYREVAALLGEPEGTIKSRIRAGLRRLRAALVQGGAEPTWTEP